MRPACQRHRIWGFGPAGWALLPVLAFLIWAAATGYPLQHQFLRAVAATLGIDALFAVVSRILPGLWFSTFSHEWAPTSLCVALLSMFAAPRRPRAWGYALLVTSALVAPILPWMLIRRVPPFHPWPSFEMCQYAAAIGAAACFAVAAQSLRLGAAVAVLTIGGVFAQHALTASQAYQVLAWSGWAWHGLLGLVITGWAFLERRSMLPDYACQSCGYDLRDLSAAAACPECGAPRPAAPGAR